MSRQSRSTRALVATGAAALMGLCVAPAATAAPPGAGQVMQLPQPPTPTVIGQSQVQLPQDRLLFSRAPGTVTNQESVAVLVDGSGNPAQVIVKQQLSITGTGDYIIRERGPARAVEPLPDSLPPVLQRGAVVWQGFSPGARQLGATLTLDPVLEEARLPIALSIAFTPDGGSAQPIATDWSVNGPGVVTLTIDNLTAAQYSIPRGMGDAVEVAAALDSIRASQRAGRTVLAGRGLPARLRSTTPVTVQERTVRAPFDLVGGAAFIPKGSESAGTTVTVDGSLNESRSVTLRVTGAGTVSFELAASPRLGALVAPPKPAKTWAQWAASGPSPAAVSRATSTLMTAAAALGSISLVQPYLAANLNGATTTSFGFVPHVTKQAAVPRSPLRPRPVPIGLAAIATVLAVAGLDQLRRRL